jgi:ribonuclease Z
VFGLFGLISSLGLMGRKAILNLYGPEGLEEMVRVHLGFFGALPFELCFHVVEEKRIAYQDSKTEVIPVRLLHRTATFGYLFREKARPLNVDKARIEQYNLGVEDIRKIKEGQDHMMDDGTVVPNSTLTLPPLKQRAYAYISDTAYLPEIAEQIKGVDLLFHEATFLEQDAGLARQTFHSTAKQAALIANAAGAGKLLLGHFSTRYKSDELFLDEARSLFPESVAVKDGDRFIVEQRRRERT